MNANSVTTETQRGTGTAARVGLVLAALLGLADIVGGMTQFGADAVLPIAAVLVAIGLGVATLVLVAVAWRGAGWAIWSVIVLRAVSALTALPAFFLPGVPAEAVITATAAIAVTVLAIALILMGGRGRVAALHG